MNVSGRAADPLPFASEMPGEAIRRARQQRTLPDLCDIAHLCAENIAKFIYSRRGGWCF
jgi:hypothetical protein